MEGMKLDDITWGDMKYDITFSYKKKEMNKINQAERREIGEDLNYDLYDEY